MSWKYMSQFAGAFRSRGKTTSEGDKGKAQVSRGAHMRTGLVGDKSNLSDHTHVAQMRVLAESQIGVPYLLPILIAAYSASLLPVIAWPKLALWGAVMIAVHLAYSRMSRNFLRLNVEDIDVRVWTRRFEAFSLAFAITLSSILFLFWLPDDVQYQNYIVSTIAIALAPMTLVTVCYAPVLYCTLLPLIGGLALRFVTMGDIGNAIVAVIMVVFGLSLRHLALSINSAMSRSINLQTDKNVLIEQLFRAKRDSDAARARAEEANRAKSHFLANMSHELRTPLNAIIGFSEVMATEIFGGHSKPIYKEYSNDINRSGQHLLGLINDILDLSRIEAGRFEITEEEVDIVALAEEANRLLNIRAEAQGVTVAYDFAPNLPTLYADTRAMRQIWINLLTNAIKFSPRESVVTLLVRMEPNGDLRFGVHDQGSGISESEIDGVTEAFTQGAAGIAQPGKGSGLGLSIVKGLLQIHGGSFEIRSKLGEGTQAEAIFPEQRLLSEPVKQTAIFGL
ncbi:MAG: histidine kinase dimerization/phospho-acceptor domain-containing protein [Parvibaculum sp.]|nr:histidine kinase dimerization/phospho-acceptor domain-containing protein [Parvibaculum sp.]